MGLMGLISLISLIKCERGKPGIQPVSPFPCLPVRSGYLTIFLPLCINNPLPGLFVLIPDRA